MIIKKFQAKTEEEAVAIAKRELGENVVVMSSHNVKKGGLFSIFKKSMVEIYVGMEEENERQVAEAVSAVARTAASQIKMEAITPSDIYVNGNASNAAIFKKADIIDDRDVNIATPSKDAVIEKRLDSLQTLLEQKLTSDNDKDEFVDITDDANVTFLKLIYRTLIDNEVDERYVNEIMEEIGKIRSTKTNVDSLLSNIYQKMILMFGQPVTIPLDVDEQRVIYFIGPTGVGKTTTIAKLASQLCVNHKKKVVLLTTDTYRIAAAEQLRTYASILDIPFRVIYTEEDMKEAIKDYKEYDYVMVDTTGHSHHNEEQKDSTCQFINCVDDINKDIYLVLSATTKYKDLISISDVYSEITNYKLIFTKLDETTTYGNLFNLSMHTGAPMSYVTVGQNVPDDIEVFSPQTTVKQLLGGK